MEVLFDALTSSPSAPISPALLRILKCLVNDDDSNEFFPEHLDGFLTNVPLLESLPGDNTLEELSIEHYSLTADKLTSRTTGKDFWSMLPIHRRPCRTRNSVNVSGLSMGFVDCAIVEMGKDTPLTGLSLIVDEGDLSITYSDIAEWTHNLNPIVASSSGGYSTRRPYGGSTLDTKKPGASAAFSFTGNSVSVFGAPPEDDIGNIQFTLDGNTFNRSFARNSGAEAMHYEFFSVPSLSLEGHTLGIKYIEGPGAMRLDYILYTPNRPGQSAPPGSTTPSKAHQLSGGVVVAIVLMVVGFAAMLSLSIFWYRRRRRQEVEPFLSVPTSGYPDLVSPTGSQRKPRVPEVSLVAPPAYRYEMAVNRMPTPEGAQEAITRKPFRTSEAPKDRDKLSRGSSQSMD
ncbi:hypothetical protein DXG01_007082 [Tephrocybe rancida]|nr:hypothetical protein DXG01_007082 [Tephrocybe rancida]